jgi:hypothetical protein
VMGDGGGAGGAGAGGAGGGVSQFFGIAQARLPVEWTEAAATSESLPGTDTSLMPSVRPCVFHAHSILLFSPLTG